MSEKIKKDLQKIYNRISPDFSASRVYPWPELQVFIPYFKDNFKVLDLGCGNGRIIKLFEMNNKKCDYLGIDFSEKLIKEGQQKFPQANFKVGDITKVDFSAQSFDMVLIIATFHHLATKQERLDLLNKINSWLKPGGYLFMANWNLMQPKYLKYYFRRFFDKKSWNDFLIPWRADQKETLWRFYHSFTVGELKSLLERTNFKLEPKGVYKTEWNVNAFVTKK
ncbi:MAG: hypothetical protein COV55_04700 [Candidatus Komeilibacteria bacterium CG11_big_fil_rev_8_21_14_0_20_36_20]|uniref:Methyltransferase domain-containing protein n=1 Tax=Candidatus Komeilibacteria bacterium CG11_big_fil_rev_8_21_14_0_20_36_20 TaxID=1974477 RepID=A0A2H0NB89_9BACT|nr:MAG: hypothetical protein COV55_04700 [Candidatus Komeilibacteria bacterium CG11_big_fil_rev_8_21_14_0_20_36_20]PIR81853.1 MAG: hypothetical protein COU21_01610 [Candidatus Komeilibacteria bacterium CG10_big_fil_rev_8_21_14_0_10_36_65]PJC55061.1 MAG: hypothetical protein CO027_03965 [Candidatus Komeilibacteria bacterium CG_4_9_14_0_2_um_filter_36_13]